MPNPLLDNDFVDRVPKIISPTTHGVIDYLVVGYYFITAGACWEDNKRASITALANGAAVLGLSMFTDYWGDGRKPISFETHGKVDPGVSALVASLPNLLGFSDERESKLFQGIGIGLAAVRSLTKFDEGSSNLETRRRAA